MIANTFKRKHSHTNTLTYIQTHSRNENHFYILINKKFSEKKIINCKKEEKFTKKIYK